MTKVYKTRACLVKFASCVVATLQVAVSHAYSDDVHYWFTYFAARTVGYTDEQAYRIALADVTTDDVDSPTNPVPDWSHLNLPKQANARQLFHAFWDDRGSSSWYDNGAQYESCHISVSRFNKTYPSGEYRIGQGRILVRQAALETWTTKNGGNPGVLLHFVQDRFTHAGYGVELGQAVGKYRLLKESPDLLPGGSITDFVDFDQLAWGRAIGANYTRWIWFTGDRNVEMVRETLRILNKFKLPDQTGLDDAEDRCINLLRRMQQVSSSHKYFNEGVHAVKTSDIHIPFLGPQKIETEYAQELVDQELGKAGFFEYPQRNGIDTNMTTSRLTLMGT